MNKPEIPELLAPAGSGEALIAAVSAGADAVYLSGKQFGARKYAANFDRQEITDAVDYCHTRGVRVYVTVNTLIRDDEMKAAAEELLWLYEAGVDAVLVQDTGLIAVAHRIVPELTLHASTQMTIHNREGVRWAAEQGLKRVVIARELKLEEIEAIHNDLKDAGAELEVFVHGALCYSYSGQCLFSSLIGGRSGNRGQCAQPCRKPYTLLRGRTDEYGRPISLQPVKTTGQYLLSPHDLAVYPHLDRIAGTGIKSLKIEGRMKSPEYVATVVSIYRKALDEIAKGGWKPSKEDINDLLLAFNRGFTDGYLLGAKDGAVMGHVRPDNRGIYCGKVVSYDRRRKEATIRLNGKVAPGPGDGLVAGTGEEETGIIIRPPFDISRDTLRVRVAKPVKPGMPVSLTRSTALASKAKEIIGQKGTPLRKPTPISLTVRWDDGTPIMEGTMPGPNGTITMEMRGAFRWQPAQTRPVETGKIGELLSRTGKSPFAIKNPELHYPSDLFAPIKEINQLRRDFLALAEKRMTEAFRPSGAEVTAARKRLEDFSEETATSKTEPKIPIISAYADSTDNLRGALEGGCDLIYFEPEIRVNERKISVCGDTDIAGELATAAALCKKHGVPLIWKWPRITRRVFLDRALPLLENAEDRGIVGVMVEGIGAAEAVRSLYPDMPIYGSVGLNIYNHESVLAAKEHFTSLALSQELSSKQMKRLVEQVRAQSPSPALECMVQGAVEVVVSEDCLLASATGCGSCTGAWWGIRDERGHTFPVVADGGCRTHIYNSAETCLADHMPLLVSIGFDSLSVDLRRKTGLYARVITGIYHDAVRHVSSGEKTDRAYLENMKLRIKEMSAGGITAGYFTGKK